MTITPDDPEPELTDEDILDAMARVPGYIDISTEDFRAIYHLAWRHAMDRLRGRAAAPPPPPLPERDDIA